MDKAKFVLKYIYPSEGQGGETVLGRGGGGDLGSPFLNKLLHC